MKNTLKVVLVIVGTIIGAGFASGKEIYIFFGIYGKYAITSIIISQAIIGLIIYKVLKIVQKSEKENYEELVNKLTYNKTIQDVIKIIVKIFLVVSFYVMIAGFSAYFTQELKLPRLVGTIIIGILSYIIFMGNIERVIQVNEILMPVLIIFIIILAIKNISINTIQLQNTSKTLIESIYKGILYTSYNSITLIPILISIKKYIGSKKQIKQISVLCVSILVLLALAILTLIYIHLHKYTLKIDININTIEIPTVYIAAKTGTIYKYIYGIIMLSAILTSAVSAGYAILENYNDNPKKYKKTAIMLVLSSIFVSKLGFSNLINILYPVFGVLGIAQIILIMLVKT